MFYILSKTVSFLLLPVGLLIIMMLYIISHKNRTKAKKISVALLILFYIFSCPWLVDQAMIRYEIPAKPFSASPSYDLGIVLTGGITNEDQPDATNVYLGSSGDRLWQALFLYKQKKIRKILISGFDARTSAQNSLYEVDLCRSFLMQNGVPDEHIVLERMAKNTRENAVYTQKIIQEKFPGSSLLLITSATHLKRAQACFQKVGLNPDLHGSAYLSNHFKLRPRYFTPSSEAFFKSGVLAKEWIGCLAYRVAGYI